MTMAFATHASSELDPGARGHAFGVAMAVPVAGTVRTYRQLFAAISGSGRLTCGSSASRWGLR
jgi:hypothetical protein